MKRLSISVLALLLASATLATDTPGTVNYPGALDSVVSLFEVANNAGTTLTADVAAADTSITVVSTSGFPSTGAISIDTEAIYYTGTTATTFTGLIRGVDGTTAATHASGKIVQGRYLARHHSVLRDTIIAIETKIGSGSSTPASGQFLAGNGVGTSAWRPLVSGDIPANAANTSGNAATASASDHSIASCGASNWATGLSTTWALTCAQPGFSDLSGSASTTQGGTGNAFTKFSGPTTTEKTFTLPDASATLLYSGGPLGTPSSGIATNLTGTATALSIGGNAATASAADHGITQCGATNFVKTFSSNWTVTCAQPLFGGIGGTAVETQGGTHQTSYTLGDILYSSASNTLSKLPGNTTSTRKFLRQTGTGTVSAAPAWDTLTSGDIPANAANTSGNAATASAADHALGTCTGSNVMSGFSNNQWALNCETLGFSNISGSLADGQLSSNVALLNRDAQVFTGSYNQFVQVGIGVAPSQPGLEIFDSTAAGILALSRDSGTGRGFLKFGRHNSGTFQEVARIFGQSDDGGGPGATTNGQLVFSTNNASSVLTERMRIDGSGNVSVAGTVTSTGFLGNATTASASDHSITSCGAGTFVTGLSTAWALTCGTPSGATSHALLSSTHTDTVAASPVLGDIIYANSTPAWTKLAGNTTSTRQFLSQAGTGSVSAAPIWQQPAASDLSNGTTGSGGVVLQTSPTIYKPTLGVADGTLSGGGHVTVAGSTPTCTFSFGGGSSPSCSVVGTDAAGTITLRTGTGSPSSSGAAVLTFATAYSTNPPIIVLTAVDGDRAWGANVTLRILTESTSAPTIAWSNQSATALVSLTSSSTYKISYIALQP